MKSNRWKILVADDLAPEGLTLLREHGEVAVHKGMSPDALQAALPGVQALIVRSATRVTAASLKAADELLVIGRAGIGVDNVDIEAATERGIVVMNTPESGAITTAEHAISMLLALCRKIPLADRLLHEGRWEKSKLTGVEITGKTLGLLGLGRIGRVVADRALGLKMRVVAYDPFVAKNRVPDGITLVPFERCLAEADFVSVHVPLMDDTHHLLDDAAFAAMKRGCRLVHCARGGIVDEAALGRALEQGIVAGAALDVFEKEPMAADHPLLQQPSVIFTPHLGASTEEAKRGVARDIARQVVTCLESGTVINGINVPRISPQEAEHLTPFLNLAQRLASFVVQAFPGKLERLSVDIQGQALKHAEVPVRVAALVGALRGTGHAATPVNAVDIARGNDVVVDSTHRLIKKEYVDFVRVEAVLDGQPRFASGTLLGRRGLCMVELEHTTLDAPLHGPMLMTMHEDQPGVIGTIGTLLGNAGVNISRMQLGVRTDSSGMAMGLLSLDSRPQDALLGEIQELDFIRKAWFISLPEDE